jgi:hypothetical protein
VGINVETSRLVDTAEGTERAVEKVPSEIAINVPLEMLGSDE